MMVVGLVPSAGVVVFVGVVRVVAVVGVGYCGSFGGS